jgi:hypothetical protein
LEPHIEELLAARDFTTADRVETLGVAYAESLNPGVAAPNAFRDPAIEKLFTELKRTEEIRPNVGDPGVQVMAVEVRKSASDLGRFGEHITEIAEKAIVEAHVAENPRDRLASDDAKAEFESRFKDKFDAVRDALKEWSEALAKSAEPKASELEGLARKVRDKIEACRASLPLFGLDHINKVQAMEVSIPAALDAISAEVARQWQARAGEPSFTGMAFRLSERPLGDQIAPGVETKIKSSGGDYRRVWTDGRDALLAKLSPQEKKLLMQDFKSLDLGPNLDKWKAQADSLNGNFSLRKMQESIRGVSFAAEKYLASVEKQVKNDAVRQEFRDLLNGLQLQLRKEVVEYRSWVTPV